jgi:hypothetical protein
VAGLRHRLVTTADVPSRYALRARSKGLIVSKGRSRSIKGKRFLCVSSRRFILAADFRAVSQR